MSLEGFFVLFLVGGDRIEDGEEDFNKNGCVFVF